MAKRTVAVVLLTLILASLGASAFSERVHAWSNGGFNADPSGPIVYGTHDWIAQHALAWLPDNEKQYLVDYLNAYLYGTELPDNGQTLDGIGDTALHHVYFNREQKLVDDAAAVRALTEFNKTLTKLRSGDYYEAAKNAGVLTHYIADVASFGHVMEADTDWGSESHYSDYEEYVNTVTSSYNSTFNQYLEFHGLNEAHPYDATVNLAYDTTFDNAIYTAVWMDQHFNRTDQVFNRRVGESLNMAVNCVTDVLHTLFLKAGSDVSTPVEQPGGTVSLPIFPPVSISVLVFVVAVVVIVTMVIVTVTRRQPQPKRARGKLVRLF